MSSPAQPVVGKCYTVAEETREVLAVTAGRVYYSWPGKLAVRSVYLSTWQQWLARAAEAA